MKTLQTGLKNARHVNHYAFGIGTLGMLPKLIASRRKLKEDVAVFFVDHYF